MAIVAMILTSVVFVVLKLTESITWSWLWVLVPIWGPVLLIAVVQIVLFIKYFFDNE
jgi:hypothetical protein